MSQGTFGRLSDPPASLVLVGARVIDPSTGTDGIGDVAVHDGLIVDSPPPGAERIDADGLIVAPGLCDLHAHLRDPGGAGAETTTSGARAAARGGFTTACAMPNTEPPIDSADAVAATLARAADAACDVRVVGAATLGRAGQQVAPLEEMAAAGAVGFSDDGAAVPGPLAAEALRRAAQLGLPLIEHAEDDSAAGGGVMRAGAAADRLGLRGWPAEAEVAVVERDLALARSTGGRVHFTHLSVPASVAAVVDARAGGVRVTCDVTPHHLALTDEWIAGSQRFAWEEGGPVSSELAYDGACRVNPPLASRQEARALLALLADGSIDAIATDHAPHPPERKLVPFGRAAPGLIGLETALSIGLAAVEAGRLGLLDLVAALSTRPASIIGVSRGLSVGARADLVAFDPGARWQVDASVLASASANTPLLGMELPGVVRLTVAAGRVTYRA